MKKILFICLGNICRSPMAEYIMRQIAKENGLSISVSSAGTSGWHNGEKMHVGTQKVLQHLGIDSSDFRSSQVPDNAWETFDYLIVMDKQNLVDMEKRFFRQPEKLLIITDLLPKDYGYDHVPDPWYTGNFDETRQIITDACQILMQKIRDEHDKM